MRVLFEGGPMDGQEIDLHEAFSRYTYTPPLALGGYSSGKGELLNAFIETVEYEIHHVVNHPRGFEAIGKLR